ncbi:MAG: hypothetical protein JSS25_04425 [Proteobacteria bacterium]|nr:hypothetical protein [Pseudomonadota bacterium]
MQGIHRFLGIALIVLASTPSIALAQSSSQEGFWSKVKKAAGAAVTINGRPLNADAGSSNGAAGTYKQIRDTPLAGIFNSSAAINADYPHVAITITDFSDRLLTPQGQDPTNPAHPNDCLWFDATLWRSAKSSEKFTGLAICAADAHQGFMKGHFNGNVWLGTAPNKNTGQHRTTGPLPPFNIYPQDAGAENLTNGVGQLLLGNLLMQMGFDFTYNGNTGRVWVVSVSNKPGT